jgi:hypothetical protein
VQDVASVCPAGKVAIGGGWYLNGMSEHMTVLVSKPEQVTIAGQSLSEWHVLAETVLGTGPVQSPGWAADVYAVCVSG